MRLSGLSFRLIRIFMCRGGRMMRGGNVRASGEVEGDVVEEEVGVSGSVIDADESP